MKKRHNTIASFGMSALSSEKKKGRKKALTDGFIIAEKLTHTLVFTRAMR